MNFTISDLKKHLGPGLGLRKNKYLIEIPIPGIDGRTVNILCRSAGFPERTISTTQTFFKGRKYNMRGETNYGDSYEISLVDDSNMSIRKTFDLWLRKVDNSKPANSGLVGASFESTFLDEVEDLITLANDITTGLEYDDGLSFFLGFLDPGNANATAAYQTDVNIWQLSSSGERVYGYKLQNAFPSSVGVVTLDDGEIDTLSEFSVVFTYSEFLPLEDISAATAIGDALLGDQVGFITGGVENLFD